MDTRASVPPKTTPLMTNNEVGKEAKTHTFVKGFKTIVFETGPLNLLLFCVPIALISWGVGWPDDVTFFFALLALAPLAERLGFVTEQLALHTNDSIGGLLNATFGNATEFIVAVSGISRGLFRLVQLSLLGSILSNLLLVLGTAFLVGGYYHKEMKHEKMSAQINASLLMLATMGCIFPNVLASSNMASHLGIISLSRGISLVLFTIYLAFLVFQLKTHTHLYEDQEDEDAEEKSPMIPQSSEGIPKDTENLIGEDRLPSDGNNGAVTAVPATSSAVETQNDEEEEDEDLLGFRYSLVWLAIITVMIAFLSDAISATIENAADGAGISKIFVASIILPIVGNAAEHAGAIMFAAKNRLDITLGIAVGSSTQIALMVYPLLVLIGWMIKQDLTLDMGSYESQTLFLTVVLITFALKDGSANWLIGVTLLAAYVVIAIGFWVHFDENLN